MRVTCQASKVVINGRDRSERDHRHAASIETTLDFLNTDELDGSGRPVEHLWTLEDATGWLVDHGLLYPEESRPLDRLSARRQGHLLAHIRAARGALREIVESLVAGHQAASVRQSRPRNELFPRAAAHRAGVPRMAPWWPATATSAMRSRTRWQRSSIHSSSRWPRVRPSSSGSAPTTGAAGSSRTPPGPVAQHWCSMASCGNRAKAARHRARQRGQPPPAPVNS